MDWSSLPDHDVIAYAENTSGFHQDHIILHEVGHMISQHCSRCVFSQEQRQRIAPAAVSAGQPRLLPNGWLRNSSEPTAPDSRFSLPRNQRAPRPAR